MKLTSEQAWRVLNEAEEVCPATVLSEAIERLARQIAHVLGADNPLILAVMRGGVVFAGRLLPLLRFPLEFDYLEVTRYREATRGSTIEWKSGPGTTVSARAVLVLDDILDEGHTLAAIRAQLLAAGAGRFYSAVLADKDIGRAKPITPDFIGVKVPNRYVFGFGMDIHGAWRNLPALYALKEEL